MTNLIPPTAKKQIVVEYWVRVCSVWVILWSVCLMISAVLLWPTYVLIVGSSTAYADSVADASERTAEYESISQSLSRASKQAQTIVVSERQPNLSLIFADITAVSGQGVGVSGVTLNRNDQGVAPVQVQGEASSRQSLAAFKDRLESILYVAGVDLPIENLAQNQDIEFNLTININNEAL